MVTIGNRRDFIMIQGNHITLGIETSCDETSVAVVADGRQVLSNIIDSQIDIHTEYGGVVPEIASRKHLENINKVIQKALDTAEIAVDDVDLIGVTYGPGLVGALLVGVAAAKAISFAKDIPLVGVNHMNGHIAANYIEYPNLEPPFLSLVVSGGHTCIVNVTGYNESVKLGETRDDAAGEAFDKVARVVGLGYPGGPKVDAAAKDGNKDAIHFKRVYLEEGSLDFSFSGIKTQAINYINQQRMAGAEINANDVAASFQEAVVEVIADKAINAAVKYGQNKIAVAGGVAANSRLINLLDERSKVHGIKILRPNKKLCTDNAAMIATSAYYMQQNGVLSDWSLDANPGLDF